MLFVLCLLGFYTQKYVCSILKHSRYAAIFMSSGKKQYCIMEVIMKYWESLLSYSAMTPKFFVMTPKL